jgi:hypothetical protein
MAMGAADGYARSMNIQKCFFHSNKVGFVICFAICGTLTGCVGFEVPNAGIYENPNTFAAQDDYVYYPQYECYYSVSRHQYAYRDGNVWVARSAPHGVSADALRASPSVKMDFHDSPAEHHATVVKQYPKNWKPSVSNQTQNRKDDQHGDNNGK